MRPETERAEESYKQSFDGKWRSDAEIGLTKEVRSLMIVN